ncbi:MAG: hypothetical protein AAF438_13545 [Pseudomonadota bacterium]
MAAITVNELGETLLDQLNEIVNGGDDAVKPPKDTFVTWCQPGLPFQAEDFDFCVKGLSGGKDAEEDRKLLQQAFNFSQLIDFVPNTDGIYKNEDQATVFRTSQARLSSMYGEILKLSKVVKSELSDEEKAELEEFRGHLYTTKKEKNLVTKEETERTVDGPVLTAYKEKLAAYRDAVLKFNAKRIAAAAATGPEGKAAVADWQFNSEIYRAEVKQAADDWVAGGYQREVEQMTARINQVGLRDMTLWKQRLIEQYDRSRIAGMGPGQEFYFSTLFPGSFATSTGWQNYSIQHTETESLQKSSRKKWSAGGGLKFGMFGASGSASGSKEKFSKDFSLKDFKMSFEITQVLLSRPWMYPEFFTNRGWTLKPGDGWHFDTLPSDGGEPPQGNFIGYPTTALFIRNVKITSAEFVSEFDKMSKSLEAKGSAGWGPIRLKGSYGSSSSSQEFKAVTDKNTLTIPGMQVVGFINQLVGKAPNPAEGLKDSDFR